MLVEAAAKEVAAGTGLDGVRRLTARSFEHATMRDASRSFAGGSLPDHVDRTLDKPKLSNDLRQVANAFVQLQEARHEADYDTRRRFSRHEASLLVQSAQNAFTAWHRIRTKADGRIFLHALLAWRRWERKR